MAHDAERPNGHFGLLACGATRGWRVDLDEAADGTCSLTIDGPHCYLTIGIHDASVIADVLRYLRTAPSRKPCRLGCFDRSPVSLQWDDESGRCYVIVGPAGDSALRLTLDVNDISGLTTGFEQLQTDLSTA